MVNGVRNNLQSELFDLYGPPFMILVVKGPFLSVDVNLARGDSLSILCLGI
jgi:hypothetical protein